ncbi:MAG TPA: ankyrin repeat domain-containing protein, partial [Rhodocyclaceae bacterium]|nr:ankyrin repeat domain-containing protein [Rhodocyclaceae bacterium]
MNPAIGPRSRLTQTLRRSAARGALLALSALHVAPAQAQDTPPDLAWIADRNISPAPNAAAVRRPVTPLQFAALRPDPWDDQASTADHLGRRLIAAARDGRRELVKSLLDRGVPANGRDVAGQPPLLEAVRGGHGEIVRLLLARGADPDVKGPDGLSALGLAALRGHTEVLRRLLRAGADPDMTGDHRNTPLLDAAGLGCRPAVGPLLQHRGRVAGLGQAG